MRGSMSSNDAPSVTAWAGKHGIVDTARRMMYEYTQRYKIQNAVCQLIRRRGAGARFVFAACQVCALSKSGRQQLILLLHFCTHSILIHNNVFVLKTILEQ